MPQLLAEAYRLRLMCGLEELFRDYGYGMIAGVDEAGRGSLAGPVVAAAVLVEPQRVVPGVDDSKALRPKQRERLAEHIRSAHPTWAVAAVPAWEIDRVNILVATRSAMCQAIESLAPEPELVLIDAVVLQRFGFPCVPIIRGDGLSYAVACASILAKVERDRIMQELDLRYPMYGFARNKGYGALEHRRALSTFGPSAEHRLTFRSVLPRLKVGSSSWH